MVIEAFNQLRAVALRRANGQRTCYEMLTGCEWSLLVGRQSGDEPARRHEGGPLNAEDNGPLAGWLRWHVPLFEGDRVAAGFFAEPVNSDSWGPQPCGGCLLRRGWGLNCVRQADVATRMLGRFIFIQFRGFLLALSQVGVGRNGYPDGRWVTRFRCLNPPQNEERENHKQ